ncbi:hypothetical protein HHI36_018979 [Cryptolaemus montrouzieri]|uniref:Uncharacterized protein n=1 Tax=Cryptolaemus montrouzieri TaxID=559131 RepID=A0ABD2P2M7_9CUCU
MLHTTQTFCRRTLNPLIARNRGRVQREAFHNGTLPHTACPTPDTKSELEQEVEEHSSLLFEPLKKALRGERFNRDNEVENFDGTWFRWNKCVPSERKNLEKL